jgi:kinesin family protein 11
MRFIQYLLFPTCVHYYSKFKESANTLEYAQRARNIKNSPEVNERIVRKALMKQYNAELERLEKENCE